MPNDEILKRIRKLGLVLVVRAESAEQAIPGIHAVVDGGLRCVEITFSVPNAPAVIETVKKAFGDDLLLGAGTVLTTNQADDAISAGAEFLVAPNTDPAVIREAKRMGVPIMPGAFTPTEIVNAHNLGADVVKIFPASAVTPAYLAALRAPLPHIKMMPTGGISEKNAAEWLNAGAFALGAGGSLFDAKLLKAKAYGEMTERAKKMVDAVQAALANLK
jgi:2-dehydro-3-deoxyphosphogluconate aldolase / (4S)-4-hydroxy-2-oxoglutarate aldolase